MGNMEIMLKVDRDGGVLRRGEEARRSEMGGGEAVELFT